jgi:DNA polymerase-3 subunit alpha
MVDDFIERRHGRRKVRYDFPELREVMGATLGICVYQEQLMAVFQKLAGYSLGEADLVRRAMGKKKREELDKHKETFLKRASERGHPAVKLERLWQSFEGFADYAFNRAHSFSYGYLAYQTAYLKAHHSTHFWAAVLSNELNNTAKVVKYINEARAQGIEILPPDVNASLDNFTASGNTIRFGLAAIKGIGQSAVLCIIDARSSGGPFRSIFDFTERVDSRAVNKRVLESLIRAGAFDSLGARRAQLFAVIDSAVESGQHSQRSRASGQANLFGALGVAMQAVEPPLPDLEEWPHQDLLRGEKETLGFYISGHPLSHHEPTLRVLATADVDRLSSLTHGAQVSIGGVIMDLNIRTTKKGDRFGLFQLEDQFGSVKVVAWPEVFNKANGIIKDEAAVMISGRLEIDDTGAMTIIADDVQKLEGLRERSAQEIKIRFHEKVMDGGRIDGLFALLDANRGEAGVIFEVELSEGSVVRVQPNQFIRVKITTELMSQIEGLVPSCRVDLGFDK